MSISPEKVEIALVRAGCSPHEVASVLGSLFPCREQGPLGAGMFVRTTQRYPDYADKHLDWISVCVLRGGHPMARLSDKFWEDRRRAGLRLSAWDWFPDPDNPTRGLANAIGFAAGNGCRSFILNAEKSFRKRPRAALTYVEAARAHCDDHGLDLGLVSYSIPRTVRDFPWAEFAEHCDFGVPEIYDREHRLDPNYPSRAIASWVEAGFTRIIPACGIYRGRREDSGWSWRWRTMGEVRAHLDLFPAPLKSWIAWPLGGTPPELTLRGLAQ